MTDYEKRIKIAEIAGYRKYRETHEYDILGHFELRNPKRYLLYPAQAKQYKYMVEGWTSKDDSFCRNINNIPDYLNDLNAIQAAIQHFCNKTNNLNKLAAIIKKNHSLPAFLISARDLCNDLIEAVETK